MPFDREVDICKGTSRAINFHFRDPDRWRRIDSAYVSGNAFLNDDLLSPLNIAERFSYLRTPKEFTATLSQLNGFFAVICRIDEITFAAVDRIRSIPLFYSSKGEEFYLSNDPHWIRKEIQAKEVDEIAAAEFILTGYVTGKDTLYPDIKQLQAGEVLEVICNREGFRLRTNRYYQYIPGNYSMQSEEYLLSEFDQVLVRVFKRLIELASGRTIVVPLSGGYDSRLIVLMLKRLDYENVIAFSYGKPGNKDSEISRKVAQSLGIRWEFVPYREKYWNRWYRSEEFEKYSRMSCGLSSVPHIQDWPAIWELKRRGSIPEGSIFVPGHSADLLTGSRSRGFPDIYSGSLDILNSIEAILRFHYSLWRITDNSLKSRFRERIRSNIGIIEQFADDASIFEYWDVSERQSKFIINSLRVYEFWGYSWWLPFWDKEFMDFWRQIPVNMKIDQKIYKICVNNLLKGISGKNIKTDKEEDDVSWENMLTKSAISNLKKLAFIVFPQNIYHYYELLEAYKSTPNAFYGVVNKDKFIELYTGIENINSFLAADIMERLSAESEIANGILLEFVRLKNDRCTKCCKI